MSNLIRSRRRQDRIAALFPVLVLLALGVISFWLNTTIERAVIDRHKPGANAPEQFLEQFNSQRYDKDGTLTQQLAAERGTYFPQYNRTVVDRPVFGNRPVGNSPLDVTAAKAVVYGRNEKIDFSGGVRATQPAFNGQPARLLETETLLSVPATGEISTQSAVKMTQADTVVESNGLKFNTKTQQIAGQGPARIVLQPK
jgi:LPS export ABC transporter protein LptC